jgi:hypothetical protein
MKFLLQQAFTGKSYYGGDLLASYTAARDMLVTLRVDTTTSVAGTLALWPAVDGRHVGPVSTWAPGAQHVLCNGAAFPLPLKAGQVLNVYVSSTSAADNDESGNVYLAELDVPTEDLYTAVIERLRDDLADSAADEWSVLWHCNGIPVTTNVVDPTLTVTQRSDGQDLFADKALAAVGSTGVLKCDVTGAERGPDGETLIAKAAATINGATRTFTEIIARDRIALG